MTAFLRKPFIIMAARTAMTRNFTQKLLNLLEILAQLRYFLTLNQFHHQDGNSTTKRPFGQPFRVDR
jgi:hypothetical protein